MVKRILKFNNQNEINKKWGSKQIYYYIIKKPK